jgi:hypothetical protein
VVRLNWQQHSRAGADLLVQVCEALVIFVPKPQTQRVCAILRVNYSAEENQRIARRYCMQESNHPPTQGGSSPATFKELMKEYHAAFGDPHRQWEILRRAAALALDSGNLVQQFQVNAEMNSFEQRYGTRRG